MAANFTEIKVGLNVEPAGVTGTRNGDIRSDASTGRWKAFYSSAEHILVDQNTAETLSNKTLSLVSQLGIKEQGGGTGEVTLKVPTGVTPYDLVLPSAIGTTGQVLKLDGSLNLVFANDNTSSGTVTGPGSSTDNALARFDGTSGTIIQNSNATLSDTGDLVLALSVSASQGNFVNTTNQLVLGTTNTTTINSIAPAASRVATIPALSASDSFAFLAQSQALTNKTINASLNTISNITNTEIASGANISYSKLSLTGSVVDGDIATAAAIARSKLASGNAYRILANDSSGVMSENAALTANRSIVSDANGQLVATSVTTTEIGYVSGVTSSIQTQLGARVLTSAVGAAGGVASLDGGGKVPYSQLPSTVMSYLGTWAASTNTPTLADGTGDIGDVYVASDAGTVDFGSGNITFAAGDWVIYNGSVWQKSTNSNAVASVNGFTGVVVLTTTNIAQGTNLYFTALAAQDAVGAIVANSATVSLTYVTGTSLTAAVVAGSITNTHINASAAIAYSKLNLSASIVNADINASAAIAYSKLNLSSSIVNADINASAAIDYSKLNLSASIVNADIATGAAISLSKLASLTASRALVSDGSGVISASTVTSSELGFLTDAEAWATVNLNDNQSAAANIAQWVSTFRGVFIQYVLTRGSSIVESGRIILSCDGTNANRSVLASPIGASGVSFDCDVSGGNLRLRYTSTNTGTAPVFKYQVVGKSA